jgi:hypothetical protein
MRVTQPFDIAQGREPAERQMGVFRQPQTLMSTYSQLRTFFISIILSLIGLTAILPHALGADGERDLINYAYLSDFGLGGFDVEERQVRAFQIPFSYQLRPMQEDKWGIKLLFPVIIASAEADAIDADGIELPFDSKVTAVNPGVELQIPLSPKWALKPFGSEGRGALMGSLGLKSRYLIPWKKFQFAFGSGVFYNAYKPKDEDRKDFASVGVGWDTIYPLWFTLGGKKTNIGGYFAYYYYFDDLEFERLKSNPIEIDDQFEIGITFGTYGPIRIIWWNLKRVGIAYRFGDGLKAIRLISSFPF